ncbi:mycofactocin system transcriptional regulator [Microbacterium aquimaris]|uniref:mycofactocin system transcriptional regulator n=1 Tax=Microbacterium aquimaris TaxID=459816 RepID=UPI002AD4258F|nr:mycofactocin system transcriptional regulator [Microbacterium aquimaris]MDZ8276700.1 mycofactocin system transcriptional regulator [Microbacterium aquimaris]
MALEDQRERPRIGRAPATSHGELSHLALEMFFKRGFDETTVDDIVREAGIGRRTFFRYFPSKNDLPWGDFDRLLDGMREHLDAVPEDVPLAAALRRAVIEFNRFPADEHPYHRERMWLLLNVPTLMAHSTLRYESWRQVVAEFAARRLGQPANALAPQSIAWACLGLSLAAYEQWLAREDADLLALLDEGFEATADVLGADRA